MLFDTIFDSFGRFGGILPDVVYDVRCGQSGVGNDPNPSREISIVHYVMTFMIIGIWNLAGMKM